MPLKLTPPETRVGDARAKSRRNPDARLPTWSISEALTLTSGSLSQAVTDRKPASRRHAATMYNAVGISGCEPPQPQQFSRKINISPDFLAFAASRL